jgi:tetratricopeptide (TPR) repeat protein
MQMDRLSEQLQTLIQVFMKVKVVFFIGVMLVPFLLEAQNESWYQKGREATEPRDMVEFYTKSLENEGASVCTYYYRGVAKFDLNDFKGAEEDLTNAIKTESKYYTSIINKVDSMNNEDCSKRSYFYRGSANYYLHNYQSAIDDFSSFILIDPENQEYRNIRSSAYNLRSASYYFLKKFKLALADISKYIFLKPNDPNGYNNRGLIYLILTRYDDAIAEFNKTISINPEYASALADIGYAYMQQGKMDLAIDNFTRCLKIDDDTFSTYVDLAIIEYMKGNVQESKKYMGNAESLEPRLAKGIDGINQLEQEGYYWTIKDKETLKKMFKELN